MSFEGSSEDRLALRDLLDAYADAFSRADGEAGRRLGPTTPHGISRAWPGAIRVEGDAAAMRSYAEEIYLRDAILHRTYGIYEDFCCRVAGRWLFAERRFQPLTQLSAQEALP